MAHGQSSKNVLERAWTQNPISRCNWSHFVAGSLKSLSLAEPTAKLILSWKEDLQTVDVIKESRSIQKLEEQTGLQPSSRQVAVAIYVCMAAEILTRELTSETVGQALTDSRSLNGNFLPNVLKITKSAIPKCVTSSMDKLMKDWVGWLGSRR